MLFELTLFCLFLGISFAWTWSDRHSKSSLPPGPWGFPVLGHLPLLGSNPVCKFFEWKQKYGSIFFLRLGSFPTVVLNDPSLIREAFSRPELSARAALTFFKEVSNEKGIAFSDGTHHSEQYRFAMTSLKKSRQSISIYMEDELLVFLGRMNKLTEQAVPVMNLFGNSILNALWSSFLGYRFKDDDPKISYFRYIIRTKLMESDTLISRLSVFLPWLDRWLGRFGSRIRADTFKEVYEFVANEVNRILEKWEFGEPKSILHEYMVKVQETTDINSSFYKSENTQLFFFGDMFTGALESTATILAWFLHYLTEYPEIQTKLQEEIDSVIGRNNPPRIDDREKMPFTKACINELLRFSSILPFGIFHRAESDQILNGFRIPKDSMLMSNLYACHFDKDVWGEDAGIFKPERWLLVNRIHSDSEKDQKGNLSDGNGSRRMQRNLVPFSCGKRRCVGEEFARNSIFLYSIGLLQNFTVQKCPGAPNVRPIFGFAVAPSEFSVIFRKRKNCGRNDGMNQK